MISGPTAVGKGTVVANLKERHPEVFVSVSATTRPPRPAEVDGVSYNFITEEQFDQLIENDGLLEWATVHGVHRYGTPRAPVMAALEAGKTVILEIDLQGAEQVRHTMPEAKWIFIEPPSWGELVRRLTGRGTETDEQQRRRLETAREELARAESFDYVITNDKLETAVDDLVALLGL